MLGHSNGVAVILDWEPGHGHSQRESTKLFTIIQVMTEII